MAVQTLSAVRAQRKFLPQSGGQWLILVVLTVALLAYAMPVYVMVVTGLKSAQAASLATMWQLPTALTSGGFQEAWKRLSPNMLNSLEMVISATLLSSLLGSVNGYLFSKWKFRGSDILFTLLVFGMFIPYQSILIPLIRFLQSVGLYGKLPGLVLVHVVYGLPLTTLIFRNYFATVPNELMLPLAPPAFVVVGIFQFTNIWNDFLFGVTVVPNPAAQPITVALNNLSGSFSVDWNVVMAGAVVAAIPTALIYILLGRYFVRGLLAGSVKG